MFVGAYGLDKAESQKHLSRGNQLLNAGQLAEALTHYHAAIGKRSSKFYVRKIQVLYKNKFMFTK